MIEKKQYTNCRVFKSAPFNESYIVCGGAGWIRIVDKCPNDCPYYKPTLTKRLANFINKFWRKGFSGK